MEDTIKITNRSSGIVGYRLDERHIRRELVPNETRTVPRQELIELSQQPGGRELIYHYLYVEDDTLIKDDLNIKPEPEYYLTEDRIREGWLQTCTLDEFKDALDFAPQGIKELIKKYAVSLPLNDLHKCEAIKDQLGFDVLRAIENERATVEDEDKNNSESHDRRVVKEELAADGGRRTTTKYKVVTPES